MTPNALLPPWKHQQVAYDFALERGERGSLLAMDMGTGKSAVVAWLLANPDLRLNRVLVTCPVSVLDVWPRQITTHSGRPCKVIVLDRKKSVAAKQKEAAEALGVRWSDPLVLVIGHESLWREPFGSWAAGQKWDALVVDEGHRGAGSAGGKLTRYLARLGKVCRWRLGLTGTPLASGITSAYCQGRFIAPEVFGTSAVLFRARYPIEDHVALRLDDAGCLRIACPYQVTPTVQMLPSRKWFDRPSREWVMTATTDHVIASALMALIRQPLVLSPELEAVCRCGDYPESLQAIGLCRPLSLDSVRAEFAAKLGTFMYRCEARQVLQLPEEIHEQRTCELEPSAAKIYRSLEKEMIALVASGEVTASNALVKLIRLAQVASGHLRIDNGGTEIVSTAKRDLLYDVLEDLPLNEPVVVFSRFLADLDSVREVCEKQGRKYGELSGRRKDGMIGDLMSPEIDVLGAQIKTGGVGVDMTRAHYVISFTPDWSLSDFLQLRARSCRPGQSAPSVYYLYLVARGTVDEDVYAALSSKADAVDAVLKRMRRME